MKKAFVLLVAVILGFTTLVSAKNPPAVAAKLPADFKQEVAKHIEYPKQAKNDLIEGEVWMKITLDENKQVQIVDLSATNPALGEYIKDELNNLTIDNTSFPIGDVYFMKVKFDLLKE